MSNGVQCSTTKAARVRPNASKVMTYCSNCRRNKLRTRSILRAFRRWGGRIQSWVKSRVSIYMTENDTLNSTVSIFLSGYRIDGRRITCVAKFCSGSIECDGGWAIHYHRWRSERIFHRHWLHKIIYWGYNTRHNRKSRCCGPWSLHGSLYQPQIAQSKNGRWSVVPNPSINTFSCLGTHSRKISIVLGIWYELILLQYLNDEFHTFIWNSVHVIQPFCRHVCVSSKILNQRSVGSFGHRLPHVVSVR